MTSSLALACKDKEAAEPEPTQAATPDSKGIEAKDTPARLEAKESVEAPKATTTPTTKVHMQEHLDQAKRLLESVQQGQLEGSRTAAAWLAEHKLSQNLSKQWEPHVEMMQKAAHAARDAKDLDAASAAVGLMGEACASCHREVAAPKFAESSPPTGTDVKAQMQLHAWAADQMWLGLVGPSNEAWVRGAEAMAKAELTPDELLKDRSPGPELLGFEQTAQKLASEARAVEGLDATDKRRGEIYGKLIATCSGCHTAAKK